jgi:hypothetical protein
MSLASLQAPIRAKASPKNFHPSVPTDSSRERPSKVRSPNSRFECIKQNQDKDNETKT